MAISAAALAGLFALPSCGGGSPTPTQPVATMPPPTTQPPVAGVAPKLAWDASPDPLAGLAPLRIDFDLCKSADGSGGTKLTYLASFQGEDLADQGGCRFSHTYPSNGVTQHHTQLCVRNAAALEDCAKDVKVKAYVGVDIRVNQTTGCDGTIIANAKLLMSGFSGLTALAMVDRVQFEAFDAAGRSLDKRNGQQQDATNWTTGTWKVNNQAKLRVKATVFAGDLAGDNSQQDRPACGS
jgi:hypothetical protein